MKDPKDVAQHFTVCRLMDESPAQLIERAILARDAEHAGEKQAKAEPVRDAADELANKIWIGAGRRTPSGT